MDVRRDFLFLGCQVGHAWRFVGGANAGCGNDCFCFRALPVPGEAGNGPPSAILAEVFRSGIEALHSGQREAALSLGMTPAKAMAYIILPQAVRIVLPPVGNYAIGLLKDTALCSLIGVNELMNDAKSIAFADYQPMAVFVLVAGIYFVMSYPLSLAVRYMEYRLSRGR